MSSGITEMAKISIDETTDIITARTSSKTLIEQLAILPRRDQLKRALELLAVTNEYSEWLGQLTSEAWAYVVQNELWTAASMSLEEVKQIINWPEVCKRIERHHHTQKRRDRDSKGIRKYWSCSPEESIPAEIRPKHISVNLLQHLHRLSKKCPLERAQDLLHDMIQQRLKSFRRYKMSYLLVMDVLRVIDRITIKPQKGSRMSKSKSKSNGRVGATDTVQENLEGVREPKDGGGLLTLEQCICPKDILASIPGSRVRLSDEKGLALVGQALAIGLQAFCQRHLRLLAAGALGLYNNRSRATISRRVELVYRHRQKLRKLRKQKAKWFRYSCRPIVLQDLLGALRYKSHALDAIAFDFDEVQVFDRFAGGGSWQTWQEDGTINIPGVFDYLNQVDLQEMIDIEFGIYRHHHHTPAGTSRLGWLRNMYYSLVQQLVRQDPVWYALTVAARPDKHWRLISYPYITKDTDTGGEATGFLHLDLDLEAYITDGRGGSRLTSSLSLDNEDMDGCTVVVKRFQRYIRAWFLQLLQRGWKGSGRTTNCSSIYRAEDRVEWGEPVGVPCPAWGVRITLPQLIHGSTSVSTRRRRTILPWFMSIGEDHEQLEVAGCLGWSEIRRCHLDLEVPDRDPSGHGLRLGAPKERFAGSVVLGSTSALGDALVGRRKWTDPEVLRERNILLGQDAPAAARYVMEVRTRLVSQYRAAFLSMVQIEQEEFGEHSYFFAEGEQVESSSDGSASSLVLSDEEDSAMTLS
jgi:hypothetical protein